MLKANADRLYRASFLALVLLTVVDRAWMVNTTMAYASDDLAVVWLATTDYARGIFHEPFFYGQDYGVMLEALLAAPFVALGAAPIIPVAIIFGLFAIAPFLAFAFHYHAKGVHGAALLFAAMPVLLPVENGLQITALNGIALLAFVPLALRLRRPWLRSFLLFFTLGAAVFVNPNAALLAMPIAIHHLWQNRERGTWLGMLLGSMPILLLWAGVRSYFNRQDALVVNTIFDWRMHFKPYLINEGLQRSDIHFAWTAPLSGEHGTLALLMLVVAAVILFRQRVYQAAWAIMGTLALILLSFCFAKVHDGADSIFFPLSRVFLAMPLVIAWAWAQVHASVRWTTPFMVILLISATIHAGLRMQRARSTFAHALEHQEGLPVRTWPVTKIKERCAVVAELASLNAVDEIIILRGEDPFAAQFMAYGVPTFHPEAPTTWMVEHDRRAFQRGIQQRSQVGNLLVVGGTPEDLTRATRIGHSPAILRGQAPQAFILQLKDLSVAQVLDALR